MIMRTITPEEHFTSRGFLDGPGRELKEQALQFGGAAKLLEQLCDIGDKRLAEMDAAGIDMQVLSLTSPGAEQLKLPMQSHSRAIRKTIRCGAVTLPMAHFRPSFTKA